MKNGDEDEPIETENAMRSSLARWKVNLIMAGFVFLTSCRYASTKLIDETDVYDEEGDLVDYRHPVLQSMAGFFGEFLVAFILYLFYLRYDPSQLKPSEQVSFFVLALPAICDFFENMCLIFGITQIFPSIVTMSRALVLPITALMSRFLIKKLFNWKMIVALVVLISGMALAGFV